MSEENTTENVSSESTETVDTQEQVDTKSKETQGRTFTRADVSKMLAAERAKWDKEQEAKESEAKKLAKMNADEKKDYQLKQREQELADREAEIARKELTAEAKSMLSERDLPVELVAVVDLSSADSVTESINTVQKAWSEAVQKGVSERLKGGAPMKSAMQGTDEIPKWKNDFLK